MTDLLGEGRGVAEVGLHPLLAGHAGSVQSGQPPPSHVEHAEGGKVA